MKEKLDEVGFTYYLVLARLYDVDPKLFFAEGRGNISLHWIQTFPCSPNLDFYFQLRSRVHGEVCVS